MTPEQRFEKRLIGNFKEDGIYAVHIDLPGQDGFPDLLLLAHNRSMLIECKYGTRVLRISQIAFHESLRKRYFFDRILTACDMDGGCFIVHEDFGNARVTQTFVDFKPMYEYLIRRLYHD